MLIQHQTSKRTAESSFKRFSRTVPRMYSGNSASSFACKQSMCLSHATRLHQYFCYALFFMIYFCNVTRSSLYLSFSLLVIPLSLSLSTHTHACLWVKVQIIYYQYLALFNKFRTRSYQKKTKSWYKEHCTQECNNH